jgi:hypothetical protein
MSYKTAWAATVGVAVLFSCAANTKTLRGFVRIYGNEPHTYACIESGDKVYAIRPFENEAELRRLQGRALEFSVRFPDPPQGKGFFKDGWVTLLSWKVLDESGFE